MLMQRKLLMRPVPSKLLESLLCLAGIDTLGLAATKPCLHDALDASHGRRPPLPVTRTRALRIAYSIDINRLQASYSLLSEAKQDNTACPEWMTEG
jgi:hypothetical protein